MTFESRHIGNRKKGGGFIVRILLMAAILLAFVLMMRRTSDIIVKDAETDSTVVDAENRPYWPVSNDPVIRHSTFTLAYDEDEEQAKWVAYILTREELSRKFVKRTDWFEEDEAVSTGSADFYDYKGSGYTKGHLIPSADRAWNRQVNVETFLMSNISPQTYHFNGGVWRELEENVRDWARTNDRLYIVTGPVMGSSKKTIGQNKVAVPDAFFKVILDINEPELKTIGYVIPNEKTNRPLFDFAVSVDEVERMTGIDFYNQLISSSTVEDKLESDFDIALWPVDNGRYQVRVNKWNK